MGLESLYVFTMMGGLAAGMYVFEACFRRERLGARPWLVPLVTVVLFAVGVAAAATHIHSIPRAFQSVVNGTVNFRSGMIQEVGVAGCFLVLAAVDLVLVAVKKKSPFGLRVVAALAALASMITMGAAYIDAYGSPVWCDAPATLASFLTGDLAMGLALFALLSSATYDRLALRRTSFAVNAAFAVGLCLEVFAFADDGFSPASQVAALVVAPLASAVLVALSPRLGKSKALTIAVCVVSIVGVAIARYGFYASYPTI